MIVLVGVGERNRVGVGERTGLMLVRGTALTEGVDEEPRWPEARNGERCCYRFSFFNEAFTKYRYKIVF